jgi:hypothetical protein
VTRARVHVLVVAVLGVLSMAPTVGDVGGCGREASYLDVAAFARARKLEDCERCRECGIDNARCARACDPKVPSDVNIPSTCKPLLHDGEVCLRALQAASCGDYARYVDDESPSSPSECTFCRGVPAPEPTGPLGDGGP